MQTEISKKYLFLAKESSSAPQLENPPYIFNDYRYLTLWQEKIISFYLKNNYKGIMAGSCHFQGTGNIAWSPFHAPFASIYLTEDIRFEILSRFIHLMTDHLKNLGYAEIYMKHYPDFYSIYPADKLIAALFFEGFQIKQTDINHYLKVTDQPFEEKIHPMQKRRIKKCIRSGYKFTCHSNNELEFVFRKIYDFRMQKNIPVNITFKKLKALFKQFPDQYHLFSIQEAERIIAATCLVSVNASALYNFLPASDENYKTTSPMVFLIKNVYEYAHINHYRFLDLGVSSTKNKPQSGLINFKEHLGGIPGLKFQVEKIFDPTHV